MNVRQVVLKLYSNAHKHNGHCEIATADISK